MPLIKSTDYSPLRGDAAGSGALLEHFEALTVHPKNAQELKGLILQLAIQGKLTKKWRTERRLSGVEVEPATVLLENIKAEIEQQIKEKKIKKEKPLPIIEQDEIPFELPSSWLWTRLGELGSTNVGLTYKPSDISDYGVPVLRSSNIQDGELSLVDLVRVDTKYGTKDIIEEGDLLICARNGSRRLVGKCTILGHLNEVMVFGAFMAIFRSSINQYLQLFIQSPQYRSKLEGVETTTINQITQGNLKATEIPLPPLEEQKAIVSIVNQLFTEVEALEAETKTRIQLKEDFLGSALQQLATRDTATEWGFLQEHFSSFFTEKTAVKKLRESILQLAVQGKLTKHWRSENTNLEPAWKFLERIKIEKSKLLKEKKIRKEKVLPEISEDDIPYILPEGWEWCRMLDFCYLITDGAHHTPKYVDSGVPFLSVKNLSKGGIDFSDTKFIEYETHNELIKRCNPEFEDILLTKIGTTGIAKVIDVKKDFSIFVSVALLKIAKEHLYPLFIEHCINSPLIKQQSSDGTEGVGNKNLVLRKIKAFVIPMPPLEEQKAIVTKVNAVMALCAGLEKEIEQNTHHLEQLMQSCLREVFEGGI
jgi:type I restriction enzyme S subunit